MVHHLLCIKTTLCLFHFFIQNTFEKGRKALKMVCRYEMRLYICQWIFLLFFGRLQYKLEKQHWSSLKTADKPLTKCWPCFDWELTSDFTLFMSRFRHLQIAVCQTLKASVFVCNQASLSLILIHSNCLSMLLATRWNHRSVIEHKDILNAKLLKVAYLNYLAFEI